jgi:hypothetical protein
MKKLLPGNALVPQVLALGRLHLVIREMEHPAAKRIVDLGKGAPAKARGLIVDGIDDNGVGNANSLSKFPGAEIKTLDQACELFASHPRLIYQNLPAFQPPTCVHKARPGRLFHNQNW